MKSFRHRLPTLNSLMVFEAAARTMNFTRAAEELHVTQAAVSKQIRYLEDYLDCDLFHRDGKRVQLTIQGQHLYEKLNASFNYLADAVEDLSQPNHLNSITLAANTAVSHYWLNHVIRDFRKQHPDFKTNIRLITSDRTKDLFDENIDISIVYDTEPRNKWSQHILFEEELYPVASPEYLKDNPFHKDDLDTLLTYDLLDYEQIEPNWINWSLWFKHFGITKPHLKISGYSNNYITLIDSAVHGQGVTLGTRYLLDQELKNNNLIRISPFSMRSGRHYFLMTNSERYHRNEIKLMHDWLLSYCQKNPTE